MVDGAWIGRAAVRPVVPGVLRLDQALLDWLRSIAGLPVRVDPAVPAAEARAARARLAGTARTRGYVVGEPPRLAPGLEAAFFSLAAPSSVFSAVQESLGAVGRFEVRAGEVPVVVRGEGPERDYEARPDLDIADALLRRLDLPRRDSTRVGEDRGVGHAPHPADPGRCVLSAAAWRELRAAEWGAAEWGAVEDVAARVGCPADLVRAVAEPVAEARVEIVSRAGAGLATGPTAVRVTELAWVDGGAHGLWRVEEAGRDLDGEPLAVELRRDSPAALAEELTRAVRDAEGC